MGSFLYALHVAFQAVTAPIRWLRDDYARLRADVRRIQRPIDRQIAAAKRGHKPVNHLYAANRSVMHDALARGRQVAR